MAALKAISSIVGLQIVGAGTTVLVVLVMTGALGPEGYGRYAWVISMGGVGALILQRGLPVTMIKRFAPLDLRTLERPSPITNTLTHFALFSAGTLIAVGLLMPALSRPTLGRPEILWAIPVAAALACLAISDAILRAAELGVRAQFASQILRAGVLLGVSLLLAFSGLDQPEAYLALYASSALLAALVFTWPLLALTPRQRHGGGHVASTPAHFQASLARSIGNHLPVFITGFFVSPETLAYLAIAVRLTGPILFGVTASRAHFGARINHHVKAPAFDAVQRDYRSARLYSTAVGTLTAIGVLGLIWAIIRFPNWLFAEFTDTALLLTLFVLVTIFRLSLVVFGPVQLVAILLGAERYVRNLNLVMLGVLTVGLVWAGLLGEIWLSAIVMIAYGAILSCGLGLRVASQLREGLAQAFPPKQSQ
jgi:O-antigen/teichoic acid export membrane protein